MGFISGKGQKIFRQKLKQWSVSLQYLCSAIRGALWGETPPRCLQRLFRCWRNVDRPFVPSADSTCRDKMALYNFKKIMVVPTAKVSFLTPRLVACFKRRPLRRVSVPELDVKRRLKMKNMVGEENTCWDSGGLVSTDMKLMRYIQPFSLTSVTR